MLNYLDSWRLSNGVDGKYCKQCHEVQSKYKSILEEQTSLRRSIMFGFIFLIFGLLLLWKDRDMLDRIGGSVSCIIGGAAFCWALICKLSLQSLITDPAMQVSYFSEERGAVHLHWAKDMMHLEDGCQQRVNSHLARTFPWQITFFLLRPEEARMINGDNVGSLRVNTFWTVRIKSMTRFVMIDCVGAEVPFTVVNGCVLNDMVHDLNRFGSCEELRLHMRHVERVLREAMIRIGSFPRFIEETGAAERLPILSETKKLTQKAIRELDLMLPNHVTLHDAKDEVEYLNQQRKVLGLTYGPREEQGGR